MCFPCSHKLADGKTRKLMGREEFRLLHYAGEVNYNVNGTYTAHKNFRIAGSQVEFPDYLKMYCNFYR